MVKITLKKAAEKRGINHNTLHGAAKRYLKGDPRSKSLLKCERSDISTGTGKVIYTTLGNVDTWLKTKGKPGARKKN